MRSLTLIEPATPWVLETAGTPTPDLQPFMDRTHRLAGREVSDDDLSTFLVSAGVVPGDLDQADIEELPVWAGSYPLRNALSWGFPATWGDHHVDELDSIRCPTLVVRGTETAPWLGKTATLVADRIPDAELLELPGGHASHLQNPEVFLSALLGPPRQCTGLTPSRSRRCSELTPCPSDNDGEYPKRNRPVTPDRGAGVAAEDLRGSW